MVRRNALILIIMLSLSAIWIGQARGAGVGYVSSDPKTAMIVGGLSVDGRGVKPDELPLAVPAGSEVCARPHVYLDVNRRLSFSGWDDGSKSLCRRVSANQTLTAHYVEEVLIQVFSDLKKYSKSFWAEAGQPINLSVPEVVEKGDVRYVFAEWSAGEEPWSPENHLVAVKPVRI